LTHSEVNSILFNVLYNLYSIRDPELDSSYSLDEVAEEYTFGYTGQEIEETILALKWALKHKDYNFKEILPTLDFSNSQILIFVEKYLNILSSLFDESAIKVMRVPADNRELKILIVDDWKYEHVELKFAHMTYKIVEAYTVSEGLKIFSKERFDAIILSLNRSPKDNLKFLTGLRELVGQENGRRVPVLALLDKQNYIDPENLYRLGCGDYLLSPAPRYLLLQKIHRLTTKQ